MMAVSRTFLPLYSRALRDRTLHGLQSRDAVSLGCSSRRFEQPSHCLALKIVRNVDAYSPNDSVTSQKTWIFSTLAVRTWNVARHKYRRDIWHVGWWWFTFSLCTLMMKGVGSSETSRHPPDCTALHLYCHRHQSAIAYQITAQRENLV